MPNARVHRIMRGCGDGGPCVRDGWRLVVTLGRRALHLGIEGARRG